MLKNTLLAGAIALGFTVTALADSPIFVEKPAGTAASAKIQDSLAARLAAIRCAGASRQAGAQNSCSSMMRRGLSSALG